MAKIYIELLIPLIIGLMFFIWFIWLKSSTKWHNWRYKPENDRGKKGEEHRQELIRQGLPDPTRRIAKAVVGSSGQGELERRGNVQAASLGFDGKNSNSLGKGVRTRRRFNPFRRW